jgi:ferredoxin
MGVCNMLCLSGDGVESGDHPQAKPVFDLDCMSLLEIGREMRDERRFQSGRKVTFAPRVFFGGDSAYGPKNIITAVAHGHEAAVSIDRFLHGESLSHRPPPHVNLVSQKMGIHEWSYANSPSNDLRFKVPHADQAESLRSIKAEVELGYDRELAFKEAQRCLNCDVQTVFTTSLCIECDACVDICPMDCITFTENGEEAVVRAHLMAPSLHPKTQDLYISNDLPTARIMVKDEDLCLHCGLCAERCPTGAWDMQKFLLETAKAGNLCQSR